MMAPSPPGGHFVIIANDAFSLLNFRAPLMKAVLTQGWSVTALAPNFSPETRAAVVALGATPVDFPMSRTGMNPLRDAQTLMTLTRLLRSLRPDRVFAFAVKPVIYGMLAAAIARVPRRYGLIAGLGYGLVKSPTAGWRQALTGKAVRSLTRVAMRQASQVFLQNPDDLHDLRRWGVLDGGKGLVIGATGVDPDIWVPQPLPEGPPVFLLVARMLREKGIVEYAEAARRIRQDRPDARFLLLGGLDSNPGGLDQATIRAWSHIEWHGHVSDIGAWLAQASVFVLPSYYREGVPRSIQEAMALGRPVITTDWPGCRETVVDGENGFLVPVRDVDALEQAMRRFLDRPELIPLMGERSRRLVLERFDSRTINARMLAAMAISTPKAEPLSH